MKESVVNAIRHAFVVPAYGCSPYLRECLASLRAQSLPSTILISTSTPSKTLASLAEEFAVRLVEHGPNRGIGHDWNHAISAADSDWVTLAHQDDIYLPRFAERSCDLLRRYPEATLAMTGYGELLGGHMRTMTPMLGIKRLLQELAFLGREELDSQAGKRRLLRFGCAIPCPTVTLRRDIASNLFRQDLKVNLDWDAWLQLADMPGQFVRVRPMSVLHRIHAASETSDGIRGGVRAREDLEMFQRLWPTQVARLLARVYAASYEAGTK